MKTNSLLVLASFAVLAASASAASSQPDAEVVVLPTYVVTSPGTLPVERQINASLDELRLKAQAPVVFVTELPLLRAQFAANALPANGGKPVHVAKF